MSPTTQHPSTPRPSTLLARRVAAVALVAAAVLGPGALATSAAAPSAVAAQVVPVSTKSVNGVAVSGYELAVLTRVNRSRVAAGLPALRVAGGTTDVARAWASTLAGGGQLAANPSLGAALEANGSAGWRVAAENEGASADPAKLFAAFLSNPRHKANLLHAQVTTMGVGAVQAADGRWRVVVVLVDTADTRAAQSRPS